MNKVLKIIEKEPDLDTIIDRVKENNKKIKNIENILLDEKNKSYDRHVLNAFDNFNEDEKEIVEILKQDEELDFELSIIFNLFHLKSNDKISKVVQELSTIFNEEKFKRYLDERYYTSFIEIQKTDLNKEQRISIEKNIKNKKLSGIELPDEEKKKLNQIEEELSQLGLQFQTNIIKSLEKINILIPEEKLSNFPEQEKNMIKNDNNTYSINTFSDYLVFLKYSDDRELRKKAYKIFFNKADNNKDIVKKILKLKRDKSILLNFNNYAELILETRDADLPSVEKMISELLNAALEKSKEEIDTLTKFAKTIDKIESLAPYDIHYYNNKYLKENFNINSSDIKKYFELKHTLKKVLNFLSTSFDINFIEKTNIFKWHEDVIFYEIYSKQKELIGGIYFDLIERNGKSQGAWMSGLVDYGINREKNIDLPVAIVAANFSPKNEDKISLLSHHDIVTIFHEMGHAMHHLLSKVEVSDIGGTNVFRDVVEFPSQFMEYFAYDKDTLKEISKHYLTGEQLSEDIIDNIINSKNHMSANNTILQSIYAKIDIDLFSKYNYNIAELVNDIYTKYHPIKHDEDMSKTLNSFSHIFGGGYSAGYYSYKWAEILSAGSYNFVNKLENKKEGFDKFKKYILEKGGTINMVEEYTKMTGKKPDINDLLEIDGII